MGIHAELVPGKPQVNWICSPQDVPYHADLSPTLVTQRIPAEAVDSLGITLLRSHPGLIELEVRDEAQLPASFRTLDRAIRDLIDSGELRNDPPQETEQVRQAVLYHLRTDIGNTLHAHGGDIELDKIESHVIYVSLSGACSKCSAINVTLRERLLASIQTEFPWIEDVEYRALDTGKKSVGPIPLTLQRRPRRQ